MSRSGTPTTLAGTVARTGTDAGEGVSPRGHEDEHLVATACDCCGNAIAQGAERWGDGDADDHSDPSFCSRACYDAGPKGARLPPKTSTASE